MSSRFTKTGEFLGKVREFLVNTRMGVAVLMLWIVLMGYFFGGFWLLIAMTAMIGIGLWGGRGNHWSVAVVVVAVMLSQLPFESC